MARSFVEDQKGRRRDPCEDRYIKSVIFTCPWHNITVLRPPSRDIWREWTMFQNHLWFADEVEARWQLLRGTHPNVTVHKTSFSNEDLIEGKALDELSAFLGVPSPARYTQLLKNNFHMQGGTFHLLEEQILNDANVYDQDASWCDQSRISSASDSPLNINCSFWA